jgi:hypothetical protein
MSPIPSTLSLKDLPELEGRLVQQRNADLLHLGRREYELGGMALRFERCLDGEATEAAEGVCLALLYAGEPLRLRLSRAWAEFFAGMAGVTLAEIGRDKLDLLCLTRLVPHLPSSVQFQAAAYTPADLPPLQAEPVCHGSWRGVHVATGEASGHAFALEAAAGFSTYAFLLAFDPYLRRTLPPPLATLPLSMPLVAARWVAEAGDLAGLEVGDVLLIG